MKIAKPVSRSTFQKKAEECKRLKRDIYEIVINRNGGVFNTWRDYFQKEEQWNKFLREAILEHTKSVCAKS